jgi:hypothetical protein
MPFRNQSQEPTLSGGRVSMAYYNELQSVPGFEVVPFGVVENQLAFFESQVLRRPIGTAEDFQQFAKHLGVDAVLQGAITDYDPYYPPRMTLKVNWYAANPGLHPIPVGYGLPWGTKAEKKIPSWIRLESERALAREQIATQTPLEDEQSDQDSAGRAWASRCESSTVESVTCPIERTTQSQRSATTGGTQRFATAAPIGHGCSAEKKSNCFSSHSTSDDAKRECHTRFLARVDGQSK